MYFTTKNIVSFLDEPPYKDSLSTNSEYLHRTLNRVPTMFGSVNKNMEISNGEIFCYIRALKETRNKQQFSVHMGNLSLSHVFSVVNLKWG